jgi:hypothetical protein
MTGLLKALNVHFGEPLKLRLKPGPMALLLCQFNELVQMAFEARDQQWISHHRDERRRERHRQAEIYAVPKQAIHHPEERDIGIADRFVEPVFFEKAVVLRMTDVGQVTVQHEAQIAERVRVHGLP